MTPFSKIVILTPLLLLYFILKVLCKVKSTCTSLIKYEISNSNCVKEVEVNHAYIHGQNHITRLFFHNHINNISKYEQVTISPCNIEGIILLL